MQIINEGPIAEEKRHILLLGLPFRCDCGRNLLLWELMDWVLLCACGCGYGWDESGFYVIPAEQGQLVWESVQYNAKN